MAIVPLDVRFLLGCGLKWDIQCAPDTQIPSAPASNAPPAEGAGRADRSRSASPPYDPLRFTDWDVLSPLNIPFEEMVFEPTIDFTSNRAYHAAAILFFLHPDLPVKFQLGHGRPSVSRHPRQCCFAKDLRASSGAARGRGGGRRRRPEDRGDIEDVETDNETGQPSQSKRQKKTTPKARYPVFGVF
jgi:hypothetical protein